MSESVEGGHPEVASIIALLGLTRLPVESTYYRSTWVGGSGADGRPAGTAIVGLLSAVEPVSRALWHRVDGDEVWHFHAGDPIRMLLLFPDGTSSELLLGPDVLAGHRVQAVVPAGVWQACEVAAGGRWAVFGATMAPGFAGERFESGYAADLLARYPDRAADITRLAVPCTEPDRMPTGFR